MEKETKTYLNEFIRNRIDDIDNLPDAERGNELEKMSIKEISEVLSKLKDIEDIENRNEIEKRKLVQERTRQINMERHAIEADKIALIKAQTELETAQAEKMKIEADIAAGQATNDINDKNARRDRIVKYVEIGTELTIGILAIILKAEAFGRGLKFEETGTATSFSFKNAISDMNKLK